MFYYLGIDWGKRKIGLALADEETAMAFGYTVLKNNKNFFQRLQEIIRKKNVRKIVIGLPQYIRSSETEKAVQELAQKLQAENPILQTFFFNEMFTTQMAQTNLKTHGLKNIQRGDDQEAARIILQEWLDKDKR